MGGPSWGLGGLTTGEFRQTGNMGKTEAKNVLSGLEGDPCGGQELDSAPLARVEEQPRVHLASHFPSLALRGWGSLQRAPNERTRDGGNQDLPFTEERRKGPWEPWLVGER